MTLLRKNSYLPWSHADMELLRRDFPDMPSRLLAKNMGRGEKAIIAKAAELGLRKSPEYRSAAARKSAAANPSTSAEIAQRGRTGGLLGGPARAAALTARRRSEIARNAVQQRWSRRDQA